MCAFFYFEFIKLLHLCETVHDGKLGSLHLDPLHLEQHIFTGDFFIFMYFCQFLDNFP